MGCSNARLLVQAPLNNEPVPAGNPSTSPHSLMTESHNTTTTNANTTRMHLTGVDLVVERNGSYTLLLTPKTHKQLMPYVLRKKRFRILVDKSRTGNSAEENEKLMETNIDASKLVSAPAVAATTTTNEELNLEQMATDELQRTERRILGGRSIDRGNPEDDDANIESDDEGMIEEIITTVEEDKDLECKVKTKIETKKTVAQDPETHNKITKVVKTEVKEVTRTITINDSHDLERAKRELGIDDVNRYLPPTSTWNIDQTRSIEAKTTTPVAVTTTKTETIDKSGLAEATSVGRGAVIETISSVSIQQTTNETKKKKKKKSKLCSCTRPVDDDEQTKPSSVNIVEDKPKQTTTEEFPQTTEKLSVQTKPTDIQGQTLISSDLKQLIIDKKQLLIDYIHSTIFSPTKLVETDEENFKARKISSRILDLLRYDRCSSWSQMLEQLQEEYLHPSPISRILLPMFQTYENLFTQKSAQLLNTFSTIHQANDLTNIVENHDYLTVIQTSLNDHQASADEQKANNEKEINDDLSSRPSKDEQTIYDEEQMSKMLADLQIHKPITLAEAIAYQYIDIEDPKLAISYDTVQRIKNLFRPLNEENLTNVIRVKRSGEVLTDVNLVETNPFEKFNDFEPLIYQLQTSFEPTLDFTEKQFRTLAEMILNHKDQYDQMEFDITRTSFPLCDLKESSTNDFSQSDSGYSMTTATYESLASKIKIEFEPIHQETSVASKPEDLYEEEKIDLDKISAEKLAELRLTPELIQIIKSDFDGTDKTVGQAILSRELRLDTKDSNELKAYGIGDEQAMILSELFFPKQTRIIAYSPSPGRFVEAQTTYNAELPMHKIDTTIIQIQEKQLSADPLTMQRSIPDDRPAAVSTKSMQEVEVVSSSVSKKDKASAETPVYIKKRKSTSHAGLLSCFRSKKPKSTTEQQGQPTIAAPIVEETATAEVAAKPVETTTNIAVVNNNKSTVDYALLPDGRRIYIDSFRDRPGMDMSYEPADFDQRFVLPQSKSSIDYERSVIPETESTRFKSDVTEERILLIHSQTTEDQVEMVEDKSVSAPVVEEKVEEEISVVPVIETESTSIPVVKEAPVEDKVTTEPELEVEVPVEDKVTLEVEPQAEVEIKVDAPIEEKAAIEAEAEPEASVEEQTTSEPILEEQSTSESVTDEKPAWIPVPEDNLDEKSTWEPLSDEKVLTETVVEEKPEWMPVPEASQDEKSTWEPVAEVSPEAKLPLVSVSEVQVEEKPTEIPVPEVKIEEKIAEKEKKIVLDLHAASVSLPDVELVQPGPLPRLSLTKRKKSDEKVKKSSIGLCASCFGGKSAAKRRKESNLAPIEAKVAVVEEKQEVVITPVEPIEVKEEKAETKVDLPILPLVNIDVFRERTFEKTPEGKSVIGTVLPEKSDTKFIPSTESAFTSVTAKPLTTTIEKNDLTSIYTNANIDNFRERDFQTGFVVKTHEEIVEQHDEKPNVTTIVVDVEPTPKETTVIQHVNIDTFRERDFDKKDEIRVETPIVDEIQPVAEVLIEETKENVVEVETPIPPKEIQEPHYQIPIETEVPAPPVTTTTKTNENSAYSQVNIDVFRERTYPIPSESRTTKKTVEVVEEKHYETPVNEPVRTTTSNIDETSIYSQVKIDVFRERDFPLVTEKPVKKVEPLTTATYDVPRPIDPEPNASIEKTTTTTTVVAIPQVEPVKNETMVKTTSTKKKSKSKFFTKLFRPRVPALNLPSVDQSIVLNNVPRPPHRRESDPLQIPNLHLPQPDVELPHYDRPEVNMKTGQLPNKDEFSVPKVRLPILRDVELPETDKKTIEIHPKPLTIEEKYSITDTRFIETTETPVIDKEKRSVEFQFALPPAEPVPTLTKGSIATPPSFDDDVPSGPSKIVPAVQYSTSPTTKSSIEVKKSSTFPLCSCFGRKSRTAAAAVSTPPATNQSRTIVVPKTDLPPVDFAPPSSNVSQLLKTNENLRAPTSNLPPVDLSAKETENVRLPSLSSFRSNEEKRVESIATDQQNVVSTGSIDHWNRLKTILIDEISKVHNERKSTEKLVENAVELVKEKKIDNFDDLKEKLTTNEKKNLHLIDPIVRSIRFTIEKHGLENVDQVEFPTSIGDLVRSNNDTIVSLGTTNMPKKEISRTCFTCNRSKKSSVITTNSDAFIDERRRTQLHDHRQQLTETLINQIQSNQPTIERCVEQPKETEKLVRKTLNIVSQGKCQSYEQIRHELKRENKQTFHLVDPIVDVIRDTIDHCDLTQINDKTNLEIVKSHVNQAAQLYNNEIPLLNADELRAVKTNQLSWLENHFNENKFSKKENKEFQRIFRRTFEIFSFYNFSTWEELSLQLQREFPKSKESIDRVVENLRRAHRDGLFRLENAPKNEPTKRRASTLITERAKQNFKTNRNQIFVSLKKFFGKTDEQFDRYLTKIFEYLEEQKPGQFKDFNELKDQLKKDFSEDLENHQLIEQLIDVIEQAHVANQFEDIDKVEVQSLMTDRLNGKPLVIKEMYVSLPSRSLKNSTDDSTNVNGDRTLNNGTNRHVSQRVGRGLSWREANERARILFYRGKHPAIHYDEQSAAFDVRMLLETASGGTQEIPVTDTDVHELLNSCGVQWDGVNIISLLDHSEDVVRAAEQAALKVIREKGLVDLRTPTEVSSSS